MSSSFVDNVNSGPYMLRSGKPTRASSPGIAAADTNKYSSYNSHNSSAMHQSMLQGDTSATDLITVSGDSEVRAAKRQNVRKKRAFSKVKFHYCRYRDLLI